MKVFSNVGDGLQGESELLSGVSSQCHKQFPEHTRDTELPASSGGGNGACDASAQHSPKTVVMLAFWYCERGEHGQALECGRFQLQ